jgi:predicted protein tyrosine phosphatase
MTKAKDGLDVVICGLGEILGTFDTSVTHVVSILDPGTLEPAGLAAMPGRNLLRLRFHDVIEPDPAESVPEREHIAAIVEFGRMARAHPAPRLLIHCHAGISRSTAAAIILLTDNGEAPSRAVERVVAMRPAAWPNLRMIEIADRLLALDDRLVAAVRRHHASAVARRPELREIFIANGRAREVEGL